MKWLFGLIAAVAILVGGFWAYGWSKRSGPHEYAKVTPELVERSKAYLDANLEPLPDGWEWSVFQPEEGVALRVGRVDVPNAKGTVVVVPGFTATIELYGSTIRALREAGYNVAGFEYRGQGLSARELPNPEMGYVGSWPRLGADLAAYVETLPGNVYVFANSMGAHVALRAAGDAQPDVKGYVLTVPMVRIVTGGFPYEVARGITTFFSLTGMDGEYTEGQVPWRPDRISWGKGNDCNTNPDTAWLRDALFALNEPMRTTGTTNGWVRRTMASSDEITQADYARRIDEPVLMFTAGRESYVDTDAAAAMCGAMDSCERVHFPESSHCIVDEKPEVASRIHARTVRFLDELSSR